MQSTLKYKNTIYKNKKSSKILKAKAKAFDLQSSHHRSIF